MFGYEKSLDLVFGLRERFRDADTKVLRAWFHLGKVIDKILFHTIYNGPSNYCGPAWEDLADGISRGSNENIRGIRPCECDAAALQSISQHFLEVF